MVLLIIFLPHFIDFSENVLWTLAKNCDQLVGGYTCVCVFVSVHVYGIGEVPSPIFNFCNENIIFWEPIQGFRIEATLERVCTRPGMIKCNLPMPHFFIYKWG